MTTGMRGVRRAVWALVVGAMLVPAGMRADDPRLSVIGGSGKRGESVDVVIRLANDVGDTGVTADLDIDFPTDLVSFTPPVRTACTLAPRLETTHELGGMLVADGELGLAIFARNLVIAPLGDGDLATCTFDILPDAMDSPAPLTLAFASLNDDRGQPLPLTAIDGAILITDAPNQPNRCVADCSGDGLVAVNEVIRGVNIALDNIPLSQCPEADANGDGAVTIGELIEAVKDVISGC